MKRIGFIAMSGVRAHNAELTALGLTLPGFVDRNRIIASLPSLGLLTLAGMTPSTYAVSYHEIADVRQNGFPDDLDLVAISTFTAQFNEALAVADHYRRQGVPVVMGGITVSALADEALQHCTSVVIGEGEPLWLEVLGDFENEAVAVVVGFQRVEDERQLTVEGDVDDGADDLRHASGCALCGDGCRCGRSGLGGCRLARGSGLLRRCGFFRGSCLSHDSYPLCPGP